MYHDVFIAGTGGQGILAIGNLLAEAALAENYQVTFLPSYGVEMRGGNANCTVVISDREIGSPAVSTPQALIAMSRRALLLYEKTVRSGGLLILNSSLVPAGEVRRRDVELLAFPLNDLAAEMGNPRLANMLAMGLYAGKTGVVKLESLEAGLSEVISERNRKYLPQNLAAIRRGMELAGERRGGGIESCSPAEKEEK